MLDNFIIHKDKVSFLPLNFRLHFFSKAIDIVEDICRHFGEVPKLQTVQRFVLVIGPPLKNSKNLIAERGSTLASCPDGRQTLTGESAKIIF